MLVLALLTERESYGYELVTRLHEGGLDDLSAGTLYPVLNRLERDGQISSRLVASSAGPARKYYVPTPTGTDAAVEPRPGRGSSCPPRSTGCSPAPPRRSPHEHVVARHPRPRALPDALQLGDAGPPEGQADRARAAHRADRHGGRGRHAAGGRGPRAPPRAGRRLPERARPTGAPLGHGGRLGRARRRRRGLPGRSRTASGRSTRSGRWAAARSSGCSSARPRRSPTTTTRLPSSSTLTWQVLVFYASVFTVPFLLGARVWRVWAGSPATARAAHA